jgi:hypothetical protein
MKGEPDVISLRIFKAYPKTAGDCPDFAESSEPNGTVPFDFAVFGWTANASKSFFHATTISTACGVRDLDAQSFCRQVRKRINNRHTLDAFPWYRNPDKFEILPNGSFGPVDFRHIDSISDCRVEQPYT